MFDYESPDSYIRDATDIKKINGKFFCFRNISYKDLLNNGQIIKKGSECPLEYHKNCGKLDTLEQELCIKENEKCPLYDIGIGVQTDLDNYIYNKSANIYYNDDNYNKSDKKIIGRLILNHGQPCYNSTEKLWNAFDYYEEVKTHLKCEFEIFGKYEEDRYEERGNITYMKLYQDNLNKEILRAIWNSLNVYDKLHLYKREFFGIDKECDKKYNLNEDTYDSLHSTEKMEYYLLAIEGIVVTFFSLLYTMHEISRLFGKKGLDDYCISPKKKCIFFSIYMALLSSCTICHIIAYVRVIKNDLTGYNCSDRIINEIMRKGFEDITYNILYIKINFFLDLCLFIANCLALIIGLIWEKSKSIIPEYQEHENKNDKNEENSEKNINKEKSEQKSAEIPLSTYYPTPDN